MLTFIAQLEDKLPQTRKDSLKEICNKIFEFGKGSPSYSGRLLIIWKNSLG
jgi:hypothetical protein